MTLKTDIQMNLFLIEYVFLFIYMHVQVHV